MAWRLLHPRYHCGIRRIAQYCCHHESRYPPQRWPWYGRRDNPLPSQYEAGWSLHPYLSPYYRHGMMHSYQQFRYGQMSPDEKHACYGRHHNPEWWANGSQISAWQSLHRDRMNSYPRSRYDQTRRVKTRWFGDTPHNPNWWAHDDPLYLWRLYHCGRTGNYPRYPGDQNGHWQRIPGYGKQNNPQSWGCGPDWFWHPYRLHRHHCGRKHNYPRYPHG